MTFSNPMYKCSCVMDPYREFVIKLREKELEGGAYLEIVDDIAPVLKEIIHKLVTNKVTDGTVYSYYVETKQLISGFIPFWAGLIDDAIKSADKFSNAATKEDVFGLIVRTTDVQREKQIDFGLSFLPVDNAEERKMYDDIQEKYDKFLINLSAIMDKVKDFYKPEEWLPYTACQMKVSLRRLYSLLQFTLEFFGGFLVGKLYELEQSLADIITHVRKNYREQEELLQATHNSLHTQLFEKNKEFMGLLKLDKQYSYEMIEVNEKVDLLREKISKLEGSNLLRQINIELEYWTRRQVELKHIVDTITTLQLCQEEDAKEEEIYHSYECKELPGSKTEQWKEIGENFIKRREYTRNKLHESALALVTHFRFNNEVALKCLNYDRYCVLDSFFHQVYLFKYGLKCYHMTAGGHIKVLELNKAMYYLDENGRYTLNEKGERMYQRAKCANFYMLDEDGLLKKLKKPQEPPKPPEQSKIEADRENVLKKGSIPAEKIKYIFDNVGHILPYVLCDVAKARPKDPLTYLAHRLIVRSHNTPKSEIEKWKKEDEEYRNIIYQQRKEKALAERKKWKAQFPKRDLDADDTYMFQAIDANREDYFDYE